MFNFNDPESRRAYFRKRHTDRRTAAVLHLGGKCCRCHAVEELEFDHIDPSTKSFIIGSSAASNRVAEVFWAEVSKCQLLCAPCHRLKSVMNGDTKGGQNKIPVRCGEYSGYNNGCRCSACREWRQLYRHGKVNARGKRATSSTG